MQSDIQPIHAEHSKTHGWLPLTSLTPLKTQVACPALITEVSVALNYLPLVFLKQTDNRYLLSALMGMRPAQNLLINQSGQWLMRYMPLTMRLYPFSLQFLKQNEAVKGAVCFDHASGIYSTEPEAVEGGQRFFDDLGQPSDMMKRIMTELNQQAESASRTRRAVKAIEEADLLVPFSVADPIDGKEKPLTAFRVDEQKLHDLDAEGTNRLKLAGALPVIYAHLFSLSKLSILKGLENKQDEDQGVDSTELVEQLFGGKDDTLKFNF